jgi:uncharacterized repeat protein (TIGR03803 family)
LVLSGNTLYGTTFFGGGSSGDGTMFAVNTNGMDFTILHHFADSGTEGVNPYAGLILSGSTLFGATFEGGAYNNGAIFSLSYPAPQLTILPSGTNVNLSWPAAIEGFSYSCYKLQSTTNPALPTDWCAVSQTNVVASGQNVVTNPITGSQQFFRLSQ